MHEIVFTGITTVNEFHARIRKGIPVPEYYGDNLDSLYDVLTEMSGRVLITGADSVDEDMIPYLEKFKTLCLDVRDENPLLEIVFA